MSNTERMSKLYYGSRDKLDKIENKTEFDFIPINFGRFMEKNKEVDNRWSLWVNFEKEEVTKLKQTIYNDTLGLPEDISTVTSSMIHNSSGLLSNTSLGHKRRLIYNELDDLYFKKYLIEKYHLDGFQLKVMEGNQDLIDILYFEYEIISIQNKKEELPYFLFDGSIGEKIVKNLKLLVNNDDMYSMGLNNFSLLLDSYIFYIDIEKLLRNYENLTVEDLKRILFVPREDFHNIVSLLNNCDIELKSKIIYLMEPLKSDSEIFPCLINDIVECDKSKTITIINKNETIFKEYNYFFRDNLDVSKLVNEYENDDIIDFLVALKKAFIYNIPSLIDTRRKSVIYEKYYDEEFGPNCGQETSVAHENRKVIEEGKIYTGEDTVRKYSNLIKLVLDYIKSADNIKIDDLFNLDMDIESYNFLSSAFGMFVINKNLNKVKVRKYEYDGNKPRL